MSSYTQALYQIIFSTKYRTNCMTRDERERVFSYMAGIITNQKSIPFIINGVENHLHILMRLHPSISLSDLIRDVKRNSSRFIKEHSLFPGFIGWQNGYGAFTYSKDALPNLINYIKHQESHHKCQTFEEEYIGLLTEHGIEFDVKYLFE